MMRRGSKFWLWADCQLHCRTHDEVLENGSIVNVRSRVSRNGRAQLFIGIYDEVGAIVFEEAHDDLPNDTMTTALAWGVDRARAIASGNLVLNHPIEVSERSSPSNFQHPSKA